MIDTKFHKCKDCLHEYPLEQEFYKNPSMKSGYLNTCKSCCKAKANGWQQANPDRYMEIKAKASQLRNKKLYAKSKAFWDTYKRSDESLHNAVIRYALEEYEEADWDRTLWNNFTLEITSEGAQCWIWTRSLRNNGYPQTFVVRGNGTGNPKQSVMAHRLSYAYFYGMPPTGERGPKRTSKVIDHMCHEKRCINPMHMELVTSDENLSPSHRQPHYTGNDVIRTSPKEAVEWAWIHTREETNT